MGTTLIEWLWTWTVNTSVGWLEIKQSLKLHPTTRGVVPHVHTLYFRAYSSFVPPLTRWTKHWVLSLHGPTIQS